MEVEQNLKAHRDWTEAVKHNAFVRRKVQAKTRLEIEEIRENDKIKGPVKPLHIM